MPVLAKMQHLLCRHWPVPKYMKYIELFAGCGGLSLGLRASGGKMLLANELSPMAAETFAYNLLGEDLRDLADRKVPAPAGLKTKWLSTEYGLGDLASRLRENPQRYPPLGERNCDLQVDGLGLEGSLVVGNVAHLNTWLRNPRNRGALARLKDGFGHGNVDLVSGGPPCQSFSMAGMREYSNSRNVLPWEFAKLVELVQPKFALLENVTGILRPFKVDGKKVFAWLEVAKAFAQVGLASDGDPADPAHGYVPLCLHVNAKHAGVAQNRTRFVMLSFRRDVFDRLKGLLHGKDREFLLSSESFFDKARAGLEVQKDDLPVHDATKDEQVFQGTFLGRLVAWAKPPSAEEAIGDLRMSGTDRSGYARRLEDLLGSWVSKHAEMPAGRHAVDNHVPRTHGFEVQCRFRIYQVLSQVSAEAAISARRVLKGKATGIDDKAWDELRHGTFYMTEGMPFYAFQHKSALEQFLVQHRTGKRSQQALVRSEPAPAALSIPDDVCHFHDELDGLRTLSVREMARIQSFPDNFVFRSKATTGGAARKYQVPQYTQVGNAVPPLLGRALGEIVHDLLRLYEQRSPSVSDAMFQDAA